MFSNFSFALRSLITHFSVERMTIEELRTQRNEEMYVFDSDSDNSAQILYKQNKTLWR